MNVTDDHKRLSAILVADVVGYTRLMEQDTEGTVTAWKRARSNIIDPAIAEFSGRLVKHTGDGFLVEFQTVKEAVKCAVAMQKELISCPLDFRMGINLGDIIDDGEDIHGEGVNIAARIEALAKPGGISISASVYEQVVNRLKLPFEDMGEHAIKHVSRPVRVYQIGAGVSKVIALGPSELELPNKPSIAVLPFDNLSGDQEQEYFSDGISEDLTAALSRFDGLFVIARNSAFTYKGKMVNVKRVGQELGVRYVLEGSVRRAGNRVRINAQLIDAGADRHVWAEQFDRQIEDVFELQDDIVASIATVVGPEITTAEITRARNKRPDTLDAWDHYIRAISAYHRMTEDDLDIAISLLEKVIKVETEFANAYALLGLCHVHIGLRGWAHPVSEAFKKARKMTEEAIQLARSSPETNHALAFVLMVSGEAEAAVTAARHAIDLNVNYAEAHAVLGHALIFCGELEDGLATCQRAMRYSPRDSRGSWLYDAMGHAYFMLGDYEQAIDVSKKGLLLDPSVFGAHVTLSGAYALLGRHEDARRSIDTLLHYIPRYNLRALRKNPMFVHPELIKKLVDSMRLAGLPE